MKFLFVMASPEYLRFYDSTVELLAARGYDVTLAVNNRRERKPVGLEGLHAYADRLHVAGVVPEHDGLWGRIGTGLRGVVDFVRFLHPKFAAAPALRARIKRKVLPAAFHWIDAIPSLPPAAVSAVLRGLAACERAIPVSPAIVEYLRQQSPDVMMVSPLVDAASHQVEWIKAARACGIRSAVGIASWDNLTNKGHIRVQPDLVLLWNEAQKREAVEFHAVPPERVVVTGAQLFDRWFVRQPARDREAFCARVGLPDAQPFVLFTGSSSFISRSSVEVAFVRRWISAIRGSADPRVRHLRVVVRPHPYNFHEWGADPVADLRDIAVYPPRPYNPVDEENRADFFDSIYHSAAVVGVNTSAMIEAAIVGRPVLAIRTGEFADTQEGTLHFHHLLPENGGFVRIASTLEEHVLQLGAQLGNPDAARRETQRFVASFVRPHGLDRPATPIVVDAIERLSAAPAPLPERTPWWAFGLRPAVLAVAAVAATIGWLANPDAVARLRRRLRNPAHRVGKYARTRYRVLKDRTWGGARSVVRRAGRIRQGLPAVQEVLVRGVSRFWRQARRHARHARYHVAVMVKGGSPRNDNTPG